MTNPDYNDELEMDFNTFGISSRVFAAEDEPLEVQRVAALRHIPTGVEVACPAGRHLVPE